MRIIVVAYHFPPDPAVGSVRPARMVDALREAGHQVTVVTAALNDADPRSAESDVVRLRPWPGPRDLYRRLRGRLSRGRRQTIGVDSYFEMNQYAAPPTANAFKRFVSSLMWLPDDLHGFIPPAYRYARRRIRRGEADVVITTAPPFSVHVVGVMLRAFTRVRWLADYRDPWQGGTLKPPHVRSAFSEAVEAWAERRSLKTADAVVAASNAIARLLQQTRHEVAPQARDVVAIRNGFDPQDQVVPSASKPGRRITYLGYLYMHRDPRPFLDALASLAEEGRIDLSDVTVDFYGAGRWLNSISIEDHVKRIGIQDHVRFFDPVGPAEYRAVLADSTLLLLLAQKQPTQVPNKIYDYLAARRPIVAFADDSGETAEMLEALGGHYVITSDRASEVRETVLSAFAGEARPNPDHDRLMTEWSSDSQMKRFVELVEDLVPGLSRTGSGPKQTPRLASVRADDASKG